MVIGEKSLEGPAKRSIDAVFDGVNSFTEALDLFKKYQKVHFDGITEVVSDVHILGMTTPIKLVDIYTPTRVSTTVHRRLYEQEWRSINSKEQVKTLSSSSNTVRAATYVEDNRKVLVLGAPGSGKTTFSKYLALCNIEKSVFKKSGLKTRLFPFYLSLPALSETELDIEDYLWEKIAKKAGKHAESFVKSKLDLPKSIVLLDSLDEVSLSKKSNIIDKINEFCERYTNVKVVVSCRVSDYEGGLNAFCEVEIARLTDAAIRKIVRAWFSEQPEKSNQLINHLKADHDVYSLTETPLLLSLVCIQFKHDLNIPNRKTELYRRCIDALLRTWDTSRDFRRDTAFSSLSDDRKEKLFEHISYDFINDDFSYLFKRDEVIRKISDKLENYDGIRKEEASNVLDEIESHHGIIERYSVEAYYFSHPSFQEYFAAKAIISKRKEMEFTKKYHTDFRSYSIIPFAASLCDDPSDLLNLLVSKSNMKEIKNYPAMARRTNILYLLYRSLNAGVAISSSERKKYHEHIANSQIEMAGIYGDGGVFPLAVLEEDGVRHTYYYFNKRQTLYKALQPLRKLANEILLSPSDDYSEVALKAAQAMDIPSRDIKRIGTALCLSVPAASSKPLEVKKILVKLERLVGNDQDYLKQIIANSIRNIRHFI